MSDHDPGATATLSATSAISVREPRYWLGVYHREGSTLVPLPAGRPVVIGREAPAQVVVASHDVSRRHARFVLDDGVVQVEDLDSTNGTKVDGKRIKDADLLPGQVARLGSVECVVYVQNPGGASPTLLQSHDQLMRRLASEVEAARYFNSPLSFAMIEVQQGGEGLPAYRWLDALRGLRPVDLTGHYGGHIVEVILPRASADEARPVLEAVRTAVGRGEVHIGLATLGADGDDAPSLLTAARQALRSRETPTSQTAKSSPTFEGLIAESQAMTSALSQLDRIARAPLPVLLLGETGTGKEVLAGVVHRESERTGRFIRVNCGAIPGTLIESTLFGHEKGAFTGADRAAAGVFEAAEGGTVLLDEIGELPAGAQASLLRVLESRAVTRVGSTEERPVDIRLVAATHRDLEAMCDAGQFRRDLLFRINTFILTIPPLRDRPEDVPALVRHFLSLSEERLGPRSVREISPAAVDAMKGYAWPGNVRELRNVIERACVIAEGDTIGPGDLPEAIRGATRVLPTVAADRATEGGDEVIDLREVLRSQEVRLIVRAMRAGGNQAEAARRLSMPRRTLSHRIKALGLGPDDWSS